MDEQMMTLPVSQPNEGAREKSKKPYAKPQVIFSSPLEAMATQCPQGSGGKAVEGYLGCATARS